MTHEDVSECQNFFILLRGICSQIFQSQLFHNLVLGEQCIDHNGRDGICKPVTECDNLHVVYELYILRRDRPRYKLLQTDIESCNSTNSNSELVVCCKVDAIRSKSITPPTGKACVTPNSDTTMYSNLPGVCSGN